MSSSGSDEVVYGWANASTPAGLKALQYSDLQSLTLKKIPVLQNVKLKSA